VASAGPYVSTEGILCTVYIQLILSIYMFRMNSRPVFNRSGSDLVCGHLLPADGLEILAEKSRNARADFEWPT